MPIWMRAALVVVVVQGRVIVEHMIRYQSYLCTGKKSNSSPSFAHSRGLPQSGTIVVWPSHSGCEDERILWSFPLFLIRSILTSSASLSTSRFEPEWINLFEINTKKKTERERRRSSSEWFQKWCMLYLFRRPRTSVGSCSWLVVTIRRPVWLSMISVNRGFRSCWEVHRDG